VVCGTSAKAYCGSKAEGRLTICAIAVGVDLILKSVFLELGVAAKCRWHVEG
jgi:hypothetical protein